MRLVVAGTMALDTIETPFGRAEAIVGGAATYIALAALHYVKPVGIVSIVGTDFPSAMLQYLAEQGADLQGVVRHLSRPSFFWAGRYHADMQTRDTLETRLNVLEEFPETIPPAYQQAEFLLLGNLDPCLQQRIYRQIQPRPRVVLMDTMNFWIERRRPELEAMISQVDILSINDEEARQLAGDYSLRRCARSILARGPKYLLIKKGENGALLFSREGETYFFPAYPLEDVFDPTGAGDTFAGALIGYLAAQDTLNLEVLKEAVVQGIVMASFCVERFGVEALLTVSKQEIAARRRALIQMSHFIQVPALP